jgi:hypothetical protein
VVVLTLTLGGPTRQAAIARAPLTRAFVFSLLFFFFSFFFFSLFCCFFVVGHVVCLCTRMRIPPFARAQSWSIWVRRTPTPPWGTNKPSSRWDPSPGLRTRIVAGVLDTASDNFVLAHGDDYVATAWSWNNVRILIASW